MTNQVRIKRRASGGNGAPASLQNAELAFNEVDSTLWYGVGTGGGGGTASTIICIGGSGGFTDLTSTQTISGAKTFSSLITGSVSGNAATATKLGTARTIALTGDATASGTFDGSANYSQAITLATVNGNVGTFNGITVNAKGLVTAAAQSSLSAFTVPTASVSFGGFGITNLLDPVNPQDAVTKNYADNLAAGLDAKASVKAATTANITLSGTQTVDGISLIAGDRCLVKNQTTPSQNGIYIVAAGAWARATDMDAWSEVPNAFTFIEQGTVNGDQGWVCTADQGGTLGTTSITFVQFTSGQAYSAGNGLTVATNTFSVLANGTSLDVSASGVRINPTWIGQNTITTLGTVTTGTWNGSVVGVTYGGTGTTTSTGSGSLVLGTSPTLTTPIISGATISTSPTFTAGTNAQGQGAITTDNVVITTAASNPSGVTLPTATAGRTIIITNKGANSVNVYPATGGSIDALAANAAVALPVNGVIEFIASSTSQWYSTVSIYAPAIAQLSTGLVKGTTGTGAISTAVAGTDYSTGTSALATGLLKSTTGTGALSVAVADTDYLTPSSILDGGSY